MDITPSEPALSAGEPSAEGDLPALFNPGANCWRVEAAGRAALIVDAADYYRFAREAMMKAQQEILMIGWDFDTRISLVERGKSDDEAPEDLGPFLSWLARHRPGLNIHILKWDVGALKMLGRGSTLFRAIRWAAHKRIHFRLDGAHPPGASHHQKILVVDDALAFCGGIDMTGSRWDTREHRDRDPRRKRPTTGRRYQPWHDASMAVDGDAAKALGDLGRARWQAACGQNLPPPERHQDVWPETLKPIFGTTRVAIARTCGKRDDQEEVREIERLFVDLIAAAKRFVYFENQYFASRVIAEAICKRLAEKDGPEFLIVMPKSGDGWLEAEVMDSARARLLKTIAKAKAEARFRIYTPVTSGGADIYVHAKVMIVDDRFLKVGSANLNNRSMGLDSECDVAFDAEGCAEANEAKEKIRSVRESLMAEHLDVSAEEVRNTVKERGSIIAAVEALRRDAGRSLVPFVPEEPNVVEKAIADTQALDPESAPFEPTARPGLLHRLPQLARRARRR